MRSRCSARTPAAATSWPAGWPPPWAPNPSSPPPATAACGAGLDDFGADLGFTIEPGGDLAGVGTAILSGERVTFSASQEWPLPALPPNVVRTDRPEPGVPAVVVTDQTTHRTERVVLYRPPSLRVGVGASKGARRG